MSNPAATTITMLNATANTISVVDRAIIREKCFVRCPQGRMRWRSVAIAFDSKVPTSTAGERACDGVENVIGVGTDQRHSDDANDCDEREHERVLDHCCGFIVLHEAANQHAETVHLFLLERWGVWYSNAGQHRVGTSKRPTRERRARRRLGIPPGSW